MKQFEVTICVIQRSYIFLLQRSSFFSSGSLHELVTWWFFIISGGVRHPCTWGINGQLHLNCRLWSIIEQTHTTVVLIFSSNFYPLAQKVLKYSFKVILSEYFCIEISMKQLFIPTVITVTECWVSNPCQNTFSGIPAHFIQSGQRQSKGGYFLEGGDGQLQEGQEVS